MKGNRKPVLIRNEKCSKKYENSQNYTYFIVFSGTQYLVEQNTFEGWNKLKNIGVYTYIYIYIYIDRRKITRKILSPSSKLRNTGWPF